MSLLIKALATAEKDKQKAKGAEQTQSLTSDALTLAPFDSPSPVGMNEALSTDSTVSFASSADDGAFNDTGLSLAEEAGLISPDVKLKEDVTTKPNVPPTNSVTKQKSKADAFNEAAMASVASLKAQGSATKEGRQQAAASVFVANQAVKASSSRSALILIGVAGALMILLGLQGYQYLQPLFADEVVVVKPVAPVTPVVHVETIEASVAPDSVLPSELGEEASMTEQAIHEIDVNASEAGRQHQANNEAVKPELDKPTSGAKVNSQVFGGELATDELRVPPQKTAAVSARKQVKADEGNQRDNQASEQKESIKLVSKTPVAGVDPTLLAAYEAFNRGDDSTAQQKYRQVLQKDVRNVDALLGMAAIAQRQDRNMDAIGWYRKVTEIEPRNTIAQSAMADLEVNADGVGAESKIKSMLARQPEAANLHAALGNLYAAQNQWASAQSAYFNASQYAPISADYAFNLAISLEHLGKPKLALVQYQRALELLNITGATSPDRAQLVARIRALQ
ncbi:tetratricopeptide repeat protein [Methylotenera sp. L2L1]|uniref:tetratricopeptide repeat protein n=1 Tax=Methylotenera sp. L2L1 TaxID=1502770 RepID=UPI000561361C|nr:hypothetical protein [Methylotenera sp. L2L1]